MQLQPRIPENTEEWQKLHLSLQNAECSQINVPFLWNKPEDQRSIKFFVKRFKASKRDTVKGALLLVAGGPGDSGSLFDGYAPIYKELLNDEWDILIPDHRGTGRSNYLSCTKPNSLFSSNPQEVEACISEILKENPVSDLYGWATRQAAEDLNHFSKIYKNEELKGNDKKIAVYAVSYGTYLLNTLLNIHPEIVDAAIADSMVKPELDVQREDHHFTENSNDFLNACEDNTFCKEKFQKLYNSLYSNQQSLNWTITVSEIIGKIFENQRFDGIIDFFAAGKLFKQCLPGLFTADELRVFFANLSRQTDMRRLIFPLLYRLYRCGFGDIRWLINFYIPFKTSISNFHANYGNTLKSDDFSTLSAPSSSELMMLIISGEFTNWNDVRSLKQYNNEYFTPNSANSIDQFIYDFILKKIWPNQNQGIDPKNEDFFEKESYLLETGKTVIFPPFVRFPMAKIMNSLRSIGINRNYNSTARNEEQRFHELATDYNGPLLMLQGTLDPLTPPSAGKVWQRGFGGKPKKYFYWFKNTPHAVAFNSYMTQDRTLDCGRAIIADFLKKVSQNLPDPQPIDGLRCYHDEEYVDAKNFDFQNFLFEHNYEMLPNLLLDMKSYLLLHVDLWEGQPLLSILDVTIILLPVILICFICACCSIFLIVCGGCCVLCSFGITGCIKCEQFRRLLVEKWNNRRLSKLGKGLGNIDDEETRKLLEKKENEITYNADGSINFE